MDGQCTIEEQYDASQGGPELTHDILSIIDEECIDNAVDFTKYATISPLKKPSMDTPSPPGKLLPRKLF